MNLTIEWLKVSIEEIENYRIGEGGCVYAGSYGYGNDECYVVAIARELKDKSELALEALATDLASAVRHALAAKLDQSVISELKHLQGVVEANREVAK